MPAAAAALPDDATLERMGARIGKIDIEAREIFDTSLPEENRRLFRLANRIHRRTRERTIRKLLLFRSGDPYSRRVLEESERLLRSMDYLYDATIRPVRFHDGVVDVRVETRDVWTLRAGAGFERQGGRNEYRVAVADRNLLGWGKTVELERRGEVDRTSVRLNYHDPNVLGRWVQLAWTFADSSDGKTRAFRVERPFYALDTRRAWGVRHLSDDRVDTHYRAGEVDQRFRHREVRFEWFEGFSRGLRGGWARRWRAGFIFERHRFAVRPAETRELPPPRTLGFPWIEFEAVEDAFIEVRNLDKLVRTEDLHVGWRWRLRLGRSAPAFGADRAQWIFEGEVWRARPALERGLWRAAAGLAGRWGGGRTENLRVWSRLRYDWHEGGPYRFVAALRVEAAQRLDRDVQWLLGGGEGLRGYPLRFQDGDRRVLLNVEQRFYGPWHLWRLFYVGAVAFADAGRAWFDGAAAERPWLADVGVGLRLASSRAAQSALLHVDFAVPLRRPGNVDHWQLLVTTKETF